MGRQAGYYEWDDDDLTPGQKKEGGWHQNLYDADGHLRGSARFVPVNEFESETYYATETTYSSNDEYQLTEEQEERAQMIAEIISDLITIGIERAKPRVKRWWKNTVFPFISTQTSKIHPRRCEHGNSWESLERGNPIVETDTPEPPRMSSAEAQARVLAAIAARAYSDEQMRKVFNARIVDAQDTVDVSQILSKIPREELSAIIERMVRNPAMLEDSNLADLAGILRSAQQTAYDPIERDNNNDRGRLNHY
ncbi:hypothetical protein [Actinomyces sp. oral taxon 897]|uniref:hypothetical protein n=1 Tax=Actinomyces sp. oral taxon 897 TaxID=2081702 RepID=UPI00101ADDB3|nr:hypothetical protein [Actinomyces sp. oral taxon 897]